MRQPTSMRVSIIVLIALAWFVEICGVGNRSASAQTDEAVHLNQQVIRLYNEGRYFEAVPIAESALTLGENALGPDHPDVAASLSNLALLYDALGRYADAEPLFKRSLAINEKALGPNHPDVATSLNNLALFYNGQKRDAEPLYLRSLAIYEKALGPDHIKVSMALHNLAGINLRHGRYADAEPLLMRSPLRMRSA